VNPSTALARVLVDELVRGGVTECVLSPGSRSAPLAFALHAADAAGRLRLHVRIDERSAGFLALGLAKASGRPVAVVTTSGTATANLHPAVLEAAHSHVPMIVLTADRPPELRGTGANQTIDQIGLYGGAVRLFVDVGTPEARPGQNAYWRGLTCRALASALGELAGAPGPVHLNLGLREPLVPDGDEDWLEALDGRPGGLPWTMRVQPPAPGHGTAAPGAGSAAAPVVPGAGSAAAPVVPGAGSAATPAVADDLPARTVVVLGDAVPAATAAALDLAEARGWPVIAEPSASAGAGLTLVAAADLVLDAPGFLDGHRPARILVVGRPTLSRAVGRLVASAPADVVARGGDWSDASRLATRVLPAVPRADGAGKVDASWLPAWQSAGQVVMTVVHELLDAGPDLVEPVMAQEVVAAAGSLLVVGSSKPVRDLFLAGSRPGLRVLANRGVAGIDGTVSTAMGAALAHGGPTLALLGDLTFLHDANGLILGPEEPRPDLTVVVVNNDGGAIFGLLEQGGPGHEAAFERVFGTPHRVDLAALCAATRTPHVLASTRNELRTALAVVQGVRVVEVRTDRTAAVALDRQLHAAVARALAPGR